MVKNQIVNALAFWSLLFAFPLAAATSFAVYQRVKIEISSVNEFAEYESVWPASDVMDETMEFYSKSVWHQKIPKVEWQEELRCDTNGDGTFTHISQKPNPTSSLNVGPRELRIVGPWPAKFEDYPARSAYCCVKSIITLHLKYGAKKQIVINPTCRKWENTFYYRKSLDSDNP